MTKVIMHGCNGKMGQMITGLIAADDEIEIVAGVDAFETGNNTYPVFKSIGLCDIGADVVIDFSNAQAIDGLLDYCMEKKLPCVLCTTGLSEAQLQKVEEAGEKTAVLKSANMSLGINLLLKLLKDAAGILAPAGFDIEIVEKHHNKKVDAPSGTALALADSINEELDNAYTIVGEHDVIFAGADEVITFSHTAYSKAVFGKGAIQAAKFLAGKPAGKYDMSDVVDIG